MKGDCEMKPCDQVADYEVNAQWSIFDFVSYLSCAEHLHDFYEALQQAFVDGHPPLEIWTTAFDREV